MKCWCLSRYLWTPDMDLKKFASTRVVRQLSDEGLGTFKFERWNVDENCVNFSKLVFMDHNCQM